MHARRRNDRARRRGVVLVLILAMLGLLALIGVSFATFTGQAQSGARKYVEAAYTPTSDEVMDFALAQLINDTTNPNSALYGHSLKRDMYGTDASNNGGPYSAPLQSVAFNAGPPPTITCSVQFGYAAGNFTGWIMRVPGSLSATGGTVAQTLEVFSDSVSTSAGTETHALTLWPDDPTMTTFNIYDPSSTKALNLAQPANGVVVTLDGRYRRAFNGPGMGLTNSVNGNFKAAVAAGIAIDPGNQGMDEDYDAPDLENWFLALQSADGGVVIPSFHRPSVLAATDWTATPIQGSPKILRPRSVDNPGSGATFAEVPNGGALMYPDTTGSPATNPNYGKITYDLDNDGDGVTDSVWLDLGFPTQRDATGKTFKPLFAFTVLGLNGRLPLNTAGNLQGRQAVSDSGSPSTFNAGDPDFSHASHVSYSANEISPLYALQNGQGGGQVDNQGVAVSLTQLRNLLAGTCPFDSANPANNQDNNTVSDPNGTTIFLPNNVADDGVVPAARNTTPVAGRWGEPGLVPRILNAYTPPVGATYNWKYLNFNNLAAFTTNFPHAGRTNQLYLSGTEYVDWDAADDDFDTYDFYPRQNPDSPPFTTPSAYPEGADFYDYAGSLPIAAERLRRFVSPIDPSGNGRMTTFNNVPSGTADFGNGPDAFGRVSHFQYFRPPGMPLKTVYLDSGATPTAINQAYTDNPMYEAAFNAIAAAPTGVPPTPAQPDATNNNTMHGFQSALNPSAIASIFGAIPFNNNNNAVPTLVGPINSLSPAPPGNPPGVTPSTGGPDVANSYALGSLNIDEADEMNLYGPTQFDAPFGPQDLEWLYRKHDVDGASLDSRLSKLAPVSFLNSAGPLVGGALAHRRMFSVDSWETNHFIWANDNPNGNYPNQSHFALDASPSFSTLSVPTPSLAHRDRKINLNYPLPVSNSPVEPVRQKWIRETYELLKSVLPRESIDTPEELAQLSQFVVNIVDFRDPDGAVTKFVNTDLIITPAVPGTNTGGTATTGTPSGVTLNASASTLTDPFDPALDPYDYTTPDKPVLKPSPTPAYLVQFGMEYSPLALNEVLAYSFKRKKASGDYTGMDTPRLFVELANTLTQAKNVGGAVGTNTDSDIDLTGWDLVILATPNVSSAPPSGEDFSCRPDPITGQIPPLDPTTPPTNPPLFIKMPLKVDPGYTPAPAGPFKVPALTAGGPPPLYFAISNPLPPAVVGTSNEANTPTVQAWFSANGLQPTASTSASDPLVTALTPSPWLTSGQAKYHWIYLRRPINPLVPDSPKVVVDSMCFPFTEGGGKIVAPPPTEKVDITAARPLYSLERFQPYRGGQRVVGDNPAVPSDANTTYQYLYGFTEQTAPSTTASTLTGTYQADPPPSPNPLAITNPINQTIGAKNSNFENWDLLAFHDRDFQSVAELLLVPGCPPGLFTKKFVEQPPPFPAPTSPDANGVTYPYTVPPAKTPKNTAVVNSTPNATTYVGLALRTDIPHPFPYLVDKFYYTATDSEQSAGANNGKTAGVYGGTTSAGWFRMMDFFEVPSSAMGAIGPVAQGQNFDWLRQDVKPGLLNLNLIIDEEVFLGLIDDTRLNLAGATASGSSVPSVVTTTDLDSTNFTPGRPYAAPMQDRGFVGAVPGLKGAFADFLKLRHGGSDLLYGFGLNSLPADRPYRALSFPDIDYTVMRPAALTASNTDPGLINASATNYVNPFPVPLRRLFQIPDAIDTTPGATTPTQGHASINGDLTINTTGTLANLTNPNCSLTGDLPTANAVALGSNSASDRRAHPAFRTEWLQKVMNQTTVRTHQFAVWVTVGFFEVLPPNPLGTPATTTETLGPELGAADGRNVRYRSFFVLDRTKATGYNPQDPGDFREVVLYRRRIE